MRGGIPIPITIVIAALVVIILLPRIMEIVLSHEDEDPGIPDSEEVKTWIDLIIPDLTSSSAVPKTASTPIISFGAGKDTKDLGDELAVGLRNPLGLTKDPRCCECNVTEDEWRICVSDSCSKTDHVIDVINPEDAIYGENPYIITVSAATNFDWLCIDVKPQGG